MTKEEIISVLAELYKITGFRVSLHGADYSEIAAYPAEKRKFCRMVHKLPGGYETCVACDKTACKRALNEKSTHIYTCRYGFTEAVSPLYNFGTLTGFLMMGQVCDNKDKYSTLLTQSLFKVTNDKQKIDELFSSIKEVPKQLFDSYILIMRVIAEYVTQTNRLFFGHGNQAQLIMKYIKQNYTSKITLDVLAEKFSCSQSMLVKCFKKEYDTTIMNALMDIRLKKAAEHLKNGRMSVKEIAAECGFSEQNYFSKAFSKKYGCAPSEYRKTRD